MIQACKYFMMIEMWLHCRTYIELFFLLGQIMKHKMCGKRGAKKQPGGESESKPDKADKKKKKKSKRSSSIAPAPAAEAPADTPAEAEKEEEEEEEK